MRRDQVYERAMHQALEFKSLPIERPYLTRDEIYAERLDRFR